MLDVWYLYIRFILQCPRATQRDQRSSIEARNFPILYKNEVYNAPVNESKESFIQTFKQGKHRNECLISAHLMSNDETRAKIDRGGEFLGSLTKVTTMKYTINSKQKHYFRAMIFFFKNFELSCMYCLA